MIAVATELSWLSPVWSEAAVLPPQGPVPRAVAPAGGRENVNGQQSVEAVGVGHRCIVGHPNRVPRFSTSPQGRGPSLGECAMVSTPRLATCAGDGHAGGGLPCGGR